MVKNPPANAGDEGSVPGLGRSPGEGNGNPLQHSSLGNSMHGQRSLMDYSPWGCKRVRHNSVTRQQLLTLRSRTFRSPLRGQQFQY